MRAETDGQDGEGRERQSNVRECRGHEGHDRADLDQEGRDNGPAAPAALGGLSPDAAVRSALDCYRNALNATDEVEAGAWIWAGQWFERILAGEEGTGTLSAGKAAEEITVAEITAAEIPVGEITLPDFTERRAWPREPASDGALLSQGRTLFITRLHDLSAGGAAVNRPPALEAGIGADLTLIAPDRGINRPVQVAGIAPDRLHLRFTSALSPAEMQAAGLAPAGVGTAQTG